MAIGLRFEISWDFLRKEGQLRPTNPQCVLYTPGFFVPCVLVIVEASNKHTGSMFQDVS